MKGEIKVGKHADLAIVDLNKMSHEWESELVSGTNWNAFRGFPAIFPDHVILRGKFAINNRQVNSSCAGSFLSACNY